MAVSAGEEGNEKAPTRLCVALGCGEGLSVWFGRDTLEIVGLDVVQERLASAHVDSGVIVTNLACSAKRVLFFVDTCTLSLHDEDVLLPHSFQHHARLFPSMFHFSTDRLAGLDTMILKITTPQKVPTLIPNHTLDHDTHLPPRKRKQKPYREIRAPLADKTASNNLVCNSTTPSPACSSLL